MRDSPDSVMLFAAGFGSRMGALTADRPKPLVPVAGVPLIDHALEQVNGIAPARIVANLHYKPHALASHLSDRDVMLSWEQPEILDTGGGLRAALPLLGDGPVFTMNTDAVWKGPNPLECLRRAWRPGTMEALLLCVPAGRAHGHAGPGDFEVGSDGRARRDGALIFTGAQILETERVAEMPEVPFSMNEIWDTMLTQGTLHAIAYPGHWADAGHPEGIRAAEAMLDHHDV